MLASNNFIIFLCFLNWLLEMCMCAQVLCSWNTNMHKVVWTSMTVCSCSLYVHVSVCVLVCVHVYVFVWSCTQMLSTWNYTHTQGCVNQHDGVCVCVCVHVCSCGHVCKCLILMKFYTGVCTSMMKRFNGCFVNEWKEYNSRLLPLPPPPPPSHTHTPSLMYTWLSEFVLLSPAEWDPNKHL